MNARLVASITAFAALAIVLNAIRIPTFYWPNWYYTLAEIPVLVAFLIFGFKIGFLVEVFHIAGQEIFFPVGPGGFVVYPMGLLVMPIMFFGLYLGRKFITRKAGSESQTGEKKTAIYLTVGAATVRGGLMPLLDYFLLYNLLLPLVLGRVIPVEYVAGLVPAFVVYNVTCALYAVPAAYFVARQTCKHLRLEARLLQE
jgi:riboflavin transporter FmnP